MLINRRGNHLLFELYPSLSSTSCTHLETSDTTVITMRLLSSTVLVASIALSIAPPVLSSVLLGRGLPTQCGPANNPVHQAAAFQEGSVCNTEPWDPVIGCSLNCFDIVSFGIGTEIVGLSDLTLSGRSSAVVTNGSPLSIVGKPAVISTWASHARCKSGRPLLGSLELTTPQE